MREGVIQQLLINIQGCTCGGLPAIWLLPQPSKPVKARLSMLSAIQPKKLLTLIPESLLEREPRIASTIAWINGQINVLAGKLTM